MCIYHSLDYIVNNLKCKIIYTTVNYMKIFRYSVAVLFIFAVLVSICFYSYGRPFWLDECYLALNITDYNNYFLKLAYNQAAPPLFMYISKLLSFVPIKQEYSLRFIPLLSYICVLPVFFLLIVKVFKTHTAKLVAFTLFAFNYKVLYYSQEFKQYSSDLLIFLLIIVSYFYINYYKQARLCKILLGILFALLIWISNAAPIGILAIGIMYSYKIFKKEFDFKNYIVLFLPSLASVILYYVVMSKTINSEVLNQYWQNGFINYNLSNLFSLLFQNVSFYYINAIVAFFLILIGLFLCIKNKNWLLIISVLITLILAYIHIYPFSGRLILFLFPLSCLFIGYITDCQNKYLRYILGILISIFLVFPNIFYSYQMIVSKKYYHEDILTPLTTAKNLMKENDKLIVDGNNAVCYLYYNRVLDIDKDKVIIGADNLQEFLAHIHNLPKGKYFYVFSHSKNRNKWLNEVYLLVKIYKKYKIYSDEHGNSLFEFTIF